MTTNKQNVQGWSSLGWAMVDRKGNIDIRTVSPTRKEAMVKGLNAYACSETPETIRKMVKKEIKERGVIFIRVAISEVSIYP